MMSDRIIPEKIYAVIDGFGQARYVSTIKQVCHDHINNFPEYYTMATNEVSDEEISGEIESWVVREYVLAENNNILNK
jgi:hypothetical protein